MTRRILVLGGGPAGIEAARAAAASGAQVHLVTDGPLGGRAGWHSLVPSKVWLAAADAYGFISEAGELGVRVPGNPQIDPAAILARIRRVSETWSRQQQAELEDLGVRIVPGTGSFRDAHRILVQDSTNETVTELEGDAIIITAGSTPVFPEGMRPDGKLVLAPRFAGHLESLPEDVIVIGAGATGTEFVYLFNRLGVRVSWIIDQFGVLPGFSRPAGHFIAGIYARRGVRLVEGQMASKIERHDGRVTVETTDGRRYSASAAFLGIGRRADVSRLNLQAAGLEGDNTAGLKTDEFGRTEAAGIYAAGDVTGVPMLANQAAALARTAGLHAAGAPVRAFRPERVVKAIYSHPQVAEIGILPSEKEPPGRVRLPYTSVLKGHILPDPEGFVELAYDTESGRLLGALAAGDHAADLLAPVAVALQKEATLDDLAALAPAHPTLGELVFLAARNAHSPELHPTQ